MRVDRPRGTGPETFPRDGTQPVGLGDCQWREVQGQTRPLDLVLLAYRRLRSQLWPGRAKEGAYHRLMTIGEACQARIKEALRTTLSWAIEPVTRWEQLYEHIVAQLELA